MGIGAVIGHASEDDVHLSLALGRCGLTLGLQGAHIGPMPLASAAPGETRRAAWKLTSAIAAQQ